ncbi:zinc finger protein 608-like isoform X2 [Lineus longissimus]|uniref:zinc finger protein 608-like isoform X2 n=1 Tax=Lineus longissimus TaxID=88925 RepID=UPI00315D6DFE
MREKSTQGHSGSAVASDSNPHQVTNFKESTSQSFDDDENEWELGVGNLIIDLDADLERNSTSPISGQQPETTSPKMSGIEHQATVDKGLKMKIKRKSGGAKSETKHEIVKHDKMASIGELGSSALSPVGDKKLSPGDGKDKLIKGVRGIHKKDKSKEKTCRALEGAANMANGFPIHCGNSNDAGNGLLESDKLPFGIKRESVSTAALDPYEFNAKVEDRISMPVKKIKLEKNDPTAMTAAAPSCPGASPNQMTPRTVTPFQNVETSSSVSQPFHDASTETSHVGTITEPECLGPCEPGTSVSLEGIVWQETENGVLVVNVTWRGKTYVGTLMDSTKHDWAPPRFTCDSPTSDFEARTPKGRGKRGARGSTSTPLNDMSNYTERKLRKGRRGTNNFQAPPSPAKSDVTPVSGVKRKGRPAELDLSVNEETGRSSKRNRSNSRSTPTPAPPTPTSNSNTANVPDQSVSTGPGTLIQCPEPNCNKKYRHINGLRYHQSHAHMNNNTSDEKEDSTKSTSSGDSRPTSPPTPANTANNSDQSNGTKTPVKRTTRESESKSKSRSDSANEKSKDDSKESSVTEDMKSEKCETIPMETVSECEKKVVKPVTSQVYQISGGAMGRLGGISVLPKPVSELGMAVGVPGTVTTVTAVTVPITTVATLPVQGKGDGKDDKKKKVDKVEKASVVKPSTINRPIVPAPVPQTITLTTNGPITHSTLTAVTAHAQISPTLKAIQPKPTIMGEPSIINPALTALKEKKPKHKKKNKEKERSKSPRMKDDIAIDSKAELTSVIKSVSAGTAEIRDGAENDKLKSDAAKLPLLKECDIKVEPGSDSRVLLPSSLSLTTRLEVSTPDPTDHGSESVQSPAYSDISDAADSAPSLDNEGDIKQKDKPSSNEAPTGEHNSDSSLYGMYPYYGQAPYLIPAIPQTQAQTQPSAVSPSAASTSEPTSSKTQETKPNAVVCKPGDRLEDGKEIKKEPLSSPQLGGRDYRVPSQQQKMMPQSMYGHPQFQYLTAFGYIDPAYHSDPSYREKHEKFMEDQERLRKEPIFKQDREKAGDKDKGNISPKLPPADPGKGEKTRPVHAVSPMVTADQNKNVQKLREPKLSPQADAKDKSDMTLKEKQNENLQILKENMDLKPQMDNRTKPTVMTVGQDSYDQRTLLYARQREELQSYYMYQHQKLHEKHDAGSPHSVGEGPKVDGKKSESKMVEQVKDGEKGSPRDSPVVKREQTPSDLSKKDSNPPGDRGKSYRDKSDERRPAERPRTVDDKGRTRSPNVTPKLKTEGMPSASMSSPTAAGVIPAPAHYAQYLPAGYLQSPHAAYAQFPYDPSAMYRHGIIGYPPGAGYPVHPGHPGAPPPMRYHVSPIDLEREKSAALSSPNAPSPLAQGEPPKALDLLQQHASHYYSSHKIHELEKARPVSSPGSKPPSESSSPSVPTSSYQKPREYRQSPPPQRHVHTHHHTHLVGGYPGISPYDPYSGK